jgi:hypothetical protein
MSGSLSVMPAPKATRSDAYRAFVGRLLRPNPSSRLEARSAGMERSHARDLLQTQVIEGNNFIEGGAGGLTVFVDEVAGDDAMRRLASSRPR